MNILLAILALSFLIIVHEFGHFIVAKMSGIKVHEFSLFMGPKLFSTQYGETTYSMRLIPLGGYVRMEGEEQASNDSRAFNRKSIGVRAAVIAAGPIMNLIIALLILTVILSIMGFATNTVGTVLNNSAAFDAGIRSGDKLLSFDNKSIINPHTDLGLFLYQSKGEPVDIEILRNGSKVSSKLTPQKIPAQNRYILGFSPKEAEGKDSNVVADVSANSPAGIAGLKQNDRIVKLNDASISSRQQINDYLNKNKDKPVKVTVLRNEAEAVLDITPMLQKIPEQYTIGMDFVSKQGNFPEVVKYSFLYTYSIARSVYYSFTWLITGKVSVNQLMGPVGIVSTIGDVVQQSPTIWMIILNLANFTAFISINLGIFNLIPFPALDGSKLLLLGIEGIRKKAIPPEKEAYISMVGFVLLIMLMIFATYNDILRTFTKG